MPIVENIPSDRVDGHRAPHTEPKSSSHSGSKVEAERRAPINTPFSKYHCRKLRLESLPLM